MLMLSLLIIQDFKDTKLQDKYNMKWNCLSNYLNHFNIYKAIITQKYLCIGKSVCGKQFRAKLQAANDVGARALRRQRSDFHWKTRAHLTSNVLQNGRSLVACKPDGCSISESWLNFCSIVKITIKII